MSALVAAYPGAGCELDFETPFQLLVSVILSAQCTDKRVNIVTETLYKIASTPADFDAMPTDTLEKLIYSCGFYKNKAKNIKATARDIIERFGGEIPSTLEELTSLAGVGRKTANVILSVAFDKDAIAVDTHVFRVSKRLGFSQGKTPDAVEKDLTRLFAGYAANKVHHALIFHGRYCCKSQKPQCGGCAVREYCWWKRE
ncbi:MAG: endonuclease III [Firmicutes bacterium]|nr:endonuclease III [Bacillota bacterium]